MPKYVVDVHKTYGTCVIVEADTAEAAEQICDQYYGLIPFSEFELSEDDISVYEEITEDIEHYYKNWIHFNKSGLVQ